MGRKALYPPSVKPGIPRLGPVPCGWRKIDFGDVLEVVSRPAEVRDDQLYQLVNAKRNRGGIVPREIKLGREIKTKTQFWVSKGEFVISRRQIVHGACGIVPANLDGALVSNEYTSLTAKDGLLLDYLERYSHTTHFQQTCFHSSIGVDVEKMVFRLDDWLKHQFLLPPITEQKHLCALLGSWERAIVLVTELINAKRKLKAGLAQWIFIDKHRQTKSKKHWETVHIGVVAKCAAGGTPNTRKPEYWGGNIPWAQSGDIHRRVIDMVEGRITDLGLQNSSTKIFPAKTVFVALAGQGKTRGTVAIASIPLSANQSLAGLVCDGSRCLPEYLFHNLASRYREMRLLSKGDGGRGGLTLALIRGISIPLPSLNEQRRITTILDATDLEVVLLEKKLVALQRQKEGLIQKLLSGHIRVKV